MRPRSLSVRHWTAIRDEVPYLTGFVTGCAPLVRAEFILEQGPPDHALFMYYEDVDWCLRALASGWRLLVVPGAVVEHDVESIHGRRRFSDLAVYYMVRNRLLVAERWGTHARGVRRRLLMGWTTGAQGPWGTPGGEDDSRRRRRACARRGGA